MISKVKSVFLFSIILCVIQFCTSLNIEQCSNLKFLSMEKLIIFSQAVIPELTGKVKGDAGKICVIGGSTEYSGAPFFAAMASLRVGADLVYVVTTEMASPIIKSYSPDLIVYPFLNRKSSSKINSIITKSDIIVIGPGLGREDETMRLTYDIIQTCKDLKKPLIIDADGLYAVYKNVSILLNYPSPGVILTPNHKEGEKLSEAILAIADRKDWYNYWGNNISTLLKGEKDEYFSPSSNFSWSSSACGSGRRAGGQGDILSGSLGTIYNWALKTNLCETNQSIELAQSVAAFAAAKFTRVCNMKAYQQYGRSMTASDMLHEIHSAFMTTFHNF